MDLNTNNCPNDLTELQCEEYAKSLNLDFFFTPSILEDEYPKGCYLHNEGTGQSIYYNQDLVGSSHYSSFPICSSTSNVNYAQNNLPFLKNDNSVLKIYRIYHLKNNFTLYRCVGIRKPIFLDVIKCC